MRLVRSWWLLVLASWVALLAVGWKNLLQHAFTAGDAGHVTNQWPAASNLTLDLQRPTLLLFAHRNCPCTRQTLDALEQILTQVPVQVCVEIVLLTPEEAADDRIGEGLESRARSLPGAEVVLDPEGVEARCFGVRTSGHVVLFDKDGHLLYSGGITDGRGHAGENIGRQTVMAWLIGEAVQRRTAPVYGCPLLVDEAETESNTWQR
jgi:hypothetical protein